MSIDAWQQSPMAKNFNRLERWREKVALVLQKRNSMTTGMSVLRNFSTCARVEQDKEQN